MDYENLENAVRDRIKQLQKEKNFIKTTDKETADKLLFSGFQLVSQSNGVYTFINQLPKNFSFNEVDQTKMAYTNMLNI